MRSRGGRTTAIFSPFKSPFETGLNRGSCRDSTSGCGPERSVAGWLILRSVRNGPRGARRHRPQPGLLQCRPAALRAWRPHTRPTIPPRAASRSGMINHQRSTHPSRGATRTSRATSARADCRLRRRHPAAREGRSFLLKRAGWKTAYRIKIERISGVKSTCSDLLEIPPSPPLSDRYSCALQPPADWRGCASSRSCPR